MISTTIPLSLSLPSLPPSLPPLFVIWWTAHAGELLVYSDGSGKKSTTTSWPLPFFHRSAESRRWWSLAMKPHSPQWDPVQLMSAVKHQADVTVSSSLPLFFLSLVTISRELPRAPRARLANRFRLLSGNVDLRPPREVSEGRWMIDAMIRMTRGSPEQSSPLALGVRATTSTSKSNYSGSKVGHEGSEHAGLVVGIRLWIDHNLLYSRAESFDLARTTLCACAK